MSLKAKKRKLWGIISEYVRRKDADEYGYVDCYTCRTRAHWKEMDAGHGIPGRHNAVLFDTDIIRPQCRTCNRFNHGEQFRFGKRLDSENGAGFFERKLKESRRAVKYYESDLDDLIEYYKDKLKELVQGTSRG
jgi:hypothetical protein